jgi:hypothetical protein
MCIKAYVHGKATVREAGQVSNHIPLWKSLFYWMTKSLQSIDRSSRKIYCARYGLDVTCIAIRWLEKSSEGSRMVYFFLSYLRRLSFSRILNPVILIAVKAVLHEPPRRVLAPLPFSPISVSDYLFPGEGPADSLASLADLLDLGTLLDGDVQVFFISFYLCLFGDSWFLLLRPILN